MFYPRLIVSLAFALLLSSAVQAQETGQNDRARFCKAYYVETSAYRGPRGQCLPPGQLNDAGICTEVTEVNNVFSYIQQEDGSLDFGLSFWFEGGHHCGIIGNARETAEGWVYENNMDAEHPREQCKVFIRTENNALVLNADMNASCRSECGAQAYIEDVMFPLDSFETRRVVQQDFNPEVFYNTPCRR